MVLLLMSKVEVTVAMGEVAEETNTVVKAKRGLCDVFVLAKKFGVNSNIVDNLELGEEVQLVVASVDFSTKGES